MIDLMNIYSLTDFNRNAKEHIRRLKASGKAEVLTVNGQAEVVVQSATAYQKLLDAAELAETLSVLKKSLAAAKRGEGREARDFFKQLAAEHGIELK
jgi:PHD/YefM family antitoxin component YafN of YafNO toxin-antitoxin module